MLVITRKKNEQLVSTAPRSGENLVITVVEIRGDKVRLGLDCGMDWKIHRKEVYDQLNPPEDNTPSF